MQKEAREYIKKIDMCDECPFFVDDEEYREGELYFDRFEKYNTNGFCDLTKKEVHLISNDFPRWCPIKKEKEKIKDDED